MRIFAAPPLFSHTVRDGPPGLTSGEHDVAQQQAGVAAPGDGHDSHQFLTHSQILGVMVGIMAGMFLAALDQSIVGVALPRITSELGGLEHLSWVVTAYLLTSTAVTPLWGKISDLYGRRLIFQAAIVIFLLGSFLCGAAQDMPQLIIFRAIQGIGGGGLMAIALAIIGDVIPPRERGRYQGYFAAVFGVSSVAGPLLGGWLTDAINWRWIFYINLPIGVAALVITSMALKMPVVKRKHKIDYLGATLIVGAVSSLLLYLNYAGENWGWGDTRSLGLVALAVVLTGLFLAIEGYVSEPIIPLRLFRLSIFSIGNLYGFLSGVAMFGGIIFLPLYFQGVMGMTPTESGLAMVPMVVGIFTTSIGAGQLITRTGRYKIFPIIGAAVIIVALWLLRGIEVDTPYWQVAIYAFFFGAGLGFTMQTITVAVQNAVPFRDMGVATSTVTFTRSLGSAIGTAIFGAILNTRLATHMSDAIADAGVDPANVPIESTSDIQAMRELAEPARSLVLNAFTNSLSDVFMWAIPFVAVALLIALGLKEIPLRTGPGGGATPASAAAERAEQEAQVPVLSGH
jgi:EmrB/QacA subfamily drug resistance transporter